MMADKDKDKDKTPKSSDPPGEPDPPDDPSTQTEKEPGDRVPDGKDVEEFISAGEASPEDGGQIEAPS
jgi:hypothetical protein